ncbi:hypothetical protein [Cognatishimia sp. MH4019]|uniref:hypothetical protein n=1 Tax=Cognatishimia sp. MH4019 TaxID=2854030 RepID=UPI001CD73CA1|nr:hypothetical protein [Cognatishimia sp. MH4019]
MKIKPILPFRAVVAGSAYPKTFTVDDDLAPDSEAAKAALELGCLSDEDAVTVREALGLGVDQTSAAADKAAADKAAADKAAADKAAADKAAADKAAADKAAADKAAAEKKAQGAAPENKAGGAKD